LCRRQCSSFTAEPEIAHDAEDHHPLPRAGVPARLYSSVLF
jgi:hypothetical protein